jgi:hypothetical protein
MRKRKWNPWDTNWEKTLLKRLKTWWWVMGCNKCWSISNNSATNWFSKGCGKCLESNPIWSVVNGRVKIGTKNRMSQWKCIKCWKKIWCHVAEIKDHWCICLRWIRNIWDQIIDGRMLVSKWKWKMRVKCIKCSNIAIYSISINSTDIKPCQKCGMREVMRYTINNEYIDSFYSVAQASKVSKVRNTYIYRVCRWKRQTAGGFIWKYKTNENI